MGVVLSASVALFAQTGVMAAEGNPNYLGLLSATPPTGFTPSPTPYSLALGQNTLTFNLVVTNLTGVTQAMNLELSVDHITAYQGVDVSNGQPGVVNGAIVDGQFNEQLAVEVQDPNATILAFSIGPSATETLTFTRTLTTCGYYQVDVAKQGLTSQKGLSGFEIRVLGCGSPSISTTASPTSGPLGTAIQDSATVSGGISPTGTISFSLFGPGDTGCSSDLVSGNASFKNIAMVSGSASSPSFTTATAGTYNWIARYNGDVNNAPISSSCGAEAVVITALTPGITTAASPTTANVGALIHDSATVSGGAGPTGTVTFTLFGPGDTTCAGPALATFTAALSGGSATSGNFTTTAVGTYNWIARYNGDANNNPVSSSCGDEAVVISPVTPAITTTASPTTAIVGGVIHDSATVSGGAGPTGTVTFTLFGPGDTTCAGPALATFTAALSGGSATSGNFTTSAVGTYNWIARYNGDANNNPVSSNCGAEAVVIGPATPSIATVPSPGTGTVGTVISDTATVSGGFNPTGTVTFQLFGPGDVSCTGANLVSGLSGFANVAVVSGSASSAGFTTTAAGTYNWVASYSGDSNNNPVTSACGAEQVVITKPLGAQGCTPGFWKNPKHFVFWTGFTPTEKVSAVFTVPATFPDGSDGSSLANATLAQALAFQGGSTLNGASQILLRAATAGLLNASNPGISYPMTVTQIINSVNAALSSGDRNTIVDLAAQIDSANNGRQGCPLS